MTVTQLIESLITLEDIGYGGKSVCVECSSDMEETTVASIISIVEENTGVYIKI